ncbi:hypothetical protein AXG93_221s1090 [Marchantia polymorpha subsp. ruderalis]|uniref:Uncharacterized protein n=1 Tax=Marchantia polymorpha subsp. ruderalis TaxID=1480154 RepID=A0A176VL13_MARPO|nr:hypothetical protein AXG93_221s1090 [Marchantia polymorpha subsp. ruderalis]
MMRQQGCASVKGCSDTSEVVRLFIVLNLIAKRQREFINIIIREARQAAFGAAGIPGIDKVLEANAEPAATRRRERRAKKGGDSGSGGDNTPQNRWPRKPQPPMTRTDFRGTLGVGGHFEVKQLTIERAK